MYYQPIFNLPAMLDYLKFIYGDDVFKPFTVWQPYFEMMQKMSHLLYIEIVKEK